MKHDYKWLSSEVNKNQEEKSRKKEGLRKKSASFISLLKTGMILFVYIRLLCDRRKEVNVRNVLKRLNTFQIKFLANFFPSLSSKFRDENQIFRMHTIDLMFYGECWAYFSCVIHWKPLCICI